MVNVLHVQIIGRQLRTEKDVNQLHVHPTRSLNLMEHAMRVHNIVNLMNSRKCVLVDNVQSGKNYPLMVIVKNVLIIIWRLMMEKDVKILPVRLIRLSKEMELVNNVLNKLDQINIRDSVMTKIVMTNL